MLNRFFGYDAIEPTAGPTLSIAVSGLQNRVGYEMVLTISDDTGKIVWNELSQVGTRSCAELMINVTMLMQFIAIDHLRPPRPPAAKEPDEPPPEEHPPAPLTPLLQPAPPPAPAPPPVAPPDAPARLELPEGLLFGVGSAFSYGLMPTASLGGIGSIGFHQGAWSGALEARFDHSLVSAYLKGIPVDSLFAGATLALPCGQAGTFSGCLVTDAGGFSFSAVAGMPLGGDRTLLAFGMRVNVEQPIAQHIMVRGFAQISAAPVGAYLSFPDLDHNEVWRSPTAFATVGLTVLVNP